MIIKPYIMTKTQVKTLLQIRDTTYDVKIDTFLPLVSDDLTRRNGICNQSFLLEGTGDTTGGHTISNVVLSSSIWECLYLGAVVLINDEDGMIASYDQSAGTIILEDALTGTISDAVLLIRNFPSGAKVAASQMVLYKFKDSTVTTEMGKEAKSTSIGPVSVSFTDGSKGSEIDARFGYPSALIKGLSSVRRKRFF